MKTKLLKKIRKRFSITRIDVLASDANAIKVDAKKKYGLPFFYIEDSFYDDDPSLSLQYFFLYKRMMTYKTYNEALGALISMIHDYYYEDFKHKNEVNQKVWWKGK